MPRSNPTERLSMLVQDLYELMEAKELLRQIWTELGPYRDGEIDKKTWDKVNDHMKFDDSE